MWQPPFTPQPMNPPPPQLPGKAEVHHAGEHRPELPPNYGYIHPDKIRREQQEKEEQWQDNWKYPGLALFLFVLVAIMPGYCAFRLITGDEGLVLLIPPFCLVLFLAAWPNLIAWMLILGVIGWVATRVSKNPAVEWFLRPHFDLLILSGCAGSIVGTIIGIFFHIFGHA